MSYPNPLDSIRALISNAHELADLTRNTTRELIGMPPPVETAGLNGVKPKVSADGKLHDLGEMALFALETVRDAINETNRRRDTLINDRPVPATATAYPR